MGLAEHAELRDMADEMIAEDGQNGAIRVYTAGTGDAWNPTGATYTDHLCKIIEVDYAQGEIDGTLVQQNDKRFYIAAGGLSIVPDAGHTLLDAAGREYGVVSVKPKSPAGLDIVYVAQVRR